MNKQFKNGDYFINDDSVTPELLKAAHAVCGLTYPDGKIWSNKISFSSNDGCLQNWGDLTHSENQKHTITEWLFKEGVAPDWVIFLRHGENGYVWTDDQGNQSQYVENVDGGVFDGVAHNYKVIAIRKAATESVKSKTVADAVDKLGVWPVHFTEPDLYFDCISKCYIASHGKQMGPQQHVCTYEEFKTEVAKRAATETDDDNFTNIQDLANKMIDSWDGTGNPPIGVECEYIVMGGINWFRCKVVAYNGDIAWIDNLDSGSKPLIKLRSVEFRPLDHKVETIWNEIKEWIGKNTASTYTDLVFYLKEKGHCLEDIQSVIRKQIDLDNLEFGSHLMLKVSKP